MFIIILLKEIMKLLALVAYKVMALLCDTKQKMIIKINLNEELVKAGYKEIYDKYPFTKYKENY